VNASKWVRWRGEPIRQGGGHRVLITLIEQKLNDPGDEVLVSRSSPGNSGKVKVKVKDNPAINSIENYDIHFTVVKQGRRYGPFIIDPKLRMRLTGQ
jgi:hypothetical protein